jgi:hypothetical protein
MANLNLSKFINLTTPGGCRQLSLLTGRAVSSHHIPYLWLQILNFFYGFANFWPLVSKPSLLEIIANKASQAKSHLHMKVCVCVCVMMSSFKTFGQNKCYF